MGATDVCAGFGVSKSTGSAKSKAVRDALDIVPMDPNWYLPSKIDDNAHGMDDYGRWFHY